MLLVLDVGNTNMVAGLIDGEKVTGHWRLRSDRLRTPDEYGTFISNLLANAGVHPAEIDGSIISSVVPPLTAELRQTLHKCLEKEPVIVQPGIKTGLNIKYDNPAEVGADRIVNAVAGVELYGGPLILIDFGTATTFCVISEEREYLGGVIAPGIGISAEALFERTAKLPKVELGKPDSVIGRTTITALQAGIIYGFVGQADEIIRRIKNELPWKFKVIATGGFAELIAGESSQIQIVDRMLTLHGLRLLYHMNA